MSEDNEHPTLRARLLGRYLAEWLEHNGLSRDDVGRHLGVSPTAIDRILHGHCGDRPDVAGILALCGIAGYDRDKALELAEHSHLRTWYQILDVTDPSRWHMLDHAERMARHVTAYHPLVVPDLAQTPDYAHAVFSVTPTVWPEMIETQIAHLEKRQAVVHHDPGPSFRFIVHEHALAPTRRSRTVMATQAQHLSRLADLVNVEVHVVPDAARVIADNAPFTLLHFEENPPAVCLQHLNSMVVLENPDSVTGYQHAVTTLLDVAMNPEQSQNWLRTTSTRLSSPTRVDVRCAPGSP